MLPGKHREGEENSSIFKVEKLKKDGFAVAKRKQSLDLTSKCGKRGYSILHNFSSMSTEWDFVNNVIFLTETPR